MIIDFFVEVAQSVVIMALTNFIFLDFYTRFFSWIQCCCFLFVVIVFFLLLLFLFFIFTGCAKCSHEYVSERGLIEDSSFMRLQHEEVVLPSDIYCSFLFKACETLIHALVIADLMNPIHIFSIAIQWDFCIRWWFFCVVFVFIGAKRLKICSDRGFNKFLAFFRYITNEVVACRCSVYVVSMGAKCSYMR